MVGGQQFDGPAVWDRRQVPTVCWCYGYSFPLCGTETRVFFEDFFRALAPEKPLIEFDAAAWRQLNYGRTVVALQAFAGGSVFFCVVARISSDSRVRID